MVSFGEWSRECADEMFASIHQQLKRICSREWATLVDLSMWQLGTPDFADAIFHGAADLVELGLRREAYVGLNSVLSREQIIAMRPKHSDYAYQFFDTHIEALIWLKQEGFSIY